MISVSRSGTPLICELIEQKRACFVIKVSVLQGIALRNDVLLSIVSLFHGCPFAAVSP